LAYAVRSDPIVPAIGTIEIGKPHSEEHGSIEDELIARADHNHQLYRDDNSTVYYLLEQATRATSYAASIKPFQRTKNGRDAWLALTNQYAGKDKWEAESTRHEQLLHTRMWKGQSNFPLDKFIAQHRNAFVSLQAASERVTYQLPNEHSRIGFLLTAIQCSDAGLQAVMASIKTDQVPTGMRNDFEATASHILPYDPVMKKRTDRGLNKRDSADISTTNGEQANISLFGTKKGIGKSGVHLRYHNNAKLNEDEKDEVRLWRAKTLGKTPSTGKGKGGSDGRSKKYHKQEIATMIASAIKEHDKAARTAESDKADAEAYIMALIKKKGIKATISEVVGSTNTDKEVTDVDADNDDSDTGSAPIKYGGPPTRSIKEIITKARAAKKERDNKKKK
jgi:hypothetical protein